MATLLRFSFTWSGHHSALRATGDHPPEGHLTKESLTGGGLHKNPFFYMEKPSSVPSGHILPEEGKPVAASAENFILT